MMRETAGRTNTTFHRSQFYELLLESLGPSKHVGVAYAYHEDEVLVGVLFTILHALIQTYVLTMLTANYYGEVSEPPKKKAKKEKKPAGAVPAVN